MFLPKPQQRPMHPLDSEVRIERLVAKVTEIAANSLPQNVAEPGLGELLRALDLIVESEELQN